MTKTYLPDASVYLSSPHALFAFEDNRILIPPCVLKEMMDAANEAGPYRANAIEFNQLLDSIFDTTEKAFHEKTALLPNKGSVKLINAGYDIYSAAKNEAAIIVSRDPAVRIRARSEFGLQAEPFRAEQTPCPPPHTWAAVTYMSPRTKWLSLSKTKS